MASVSRRRFDPMENIAPRETQTRRKVLKTNAEPNTQNRKQESDMSTTEFGDVQLRPKHGRAGRGKEDNVEHLLSVHENPFIKEFGLESAMHHENKDILDADVRQNDVENSTDTEQEYHVNSGFVNKLRSRFELDTQGTSRLTHSKRSASVENLLSLGSASSSKSRSRLGSANRCSADDSKIITRSQPDFNKYGQLGLKTTERPRNKEPVKADFNKYGALSLKPSERPTNNEQVFTSAVKPIIGKSKKVDTSQSNNFLASNKPLLPIKNLSDSISVTSRGNKSAETDRAPLPEHHDWIVAPDLQKVGRDNLVIIEAVPPPPPKHSEDDSKTDEIESRQVLSLKDKKDENELPKANTVSAFRSIFENSKKLAKAVTSWQPRSETNSPRLTSGDSLPTSPLVTTVTKADDNVFKYSSKAKLTSDNKPSKSQFLYSREEKNSDNCGVNDSISSPRQNDSSDIVQFSDANEREHSIPSPFGISLADHSKRQNTGRKINVEKTLGPTMDKVQKPSIERKHKPSTDKTQKPSIDKTQKPIDKTRKPSIDKIRKPSIPVDRRAQKTPANKESRPSLERSNSSQESQSLHPFKEVFDSKSVVPSSKPTRPNVIYPSPRNEVPKDTLALKHEQDRKSRTAVVSKDDQSSIILPEAEVKLSPRDKINEDVQVDSDTAIDRQMEENILKDQTVIEEPNIKPSARKSGKTSPRQTKVFDSNNMKKFDREPPAALSPTSNKVFSFRVPSESPVQMDVAETPTKMDTTPAPVVKPIKPTRHKTEEKRANSKSANRVKTYDITKVAREPKIEQMKDIETAKPSSKQVENDNTDSPVSGMSSFLASRLKKAGNSQDTGPQPLKTTSVHLSNGVPPSPVPRKRQAPEIPNGGTTSDDSIVFNKDSAPPLPVSPEPKLPETSVDDIIKRKKKSVQQPTRKPVFDSSQISNKRKDPPKRQPAKKTVAELNADLPKPIVPRLDLESLTYDSSSQYQEGYIPTEIKPCNITFAGANVKFENGPLKKRRKNKGKLTFDDHATTTFEYETEEDALETYLREHPDERATVEREQQESTSVTLDSPEDLKLDSPRVPDPDAGMRINTVIGNSSSGALLSYKSKMAVDFQFGVPQESSDDHYGEPERESNENHVAEESLQLLPADDNDLEMFSAESSKADMLF